MPHSAGILLYRRRGDRLEVLLVHPGGPFWARRDTGAWSIPKGELAAGEDARAAAIRELTEETGWPAPGALFALEPVRQKGGKTVLAFAGEGDCDPARLHSNTFRMVWPPRSGREQEFPEVDRAAWLPIREAREKILPGQLPLLDQLEAHLAAQPDAGHEA